MNWIRVEDEMPDGWVDVLFSDGKKIYLGGYRDCYNYKRDVTENHWLSSGDVIDNVTHWMRLPELPESEKVDDSIYNESCHESASTENWFDSPKISKTGRKKCKKK